MGIETSKVIARPIRQLNRLAVEFPQRLPTDADVGIFQQIPPRSVHFRARGALVWVPFSEVVARGNFLPLHGRSCWSFGGIGQNGTVVGSKRRWAHLYCES